MSDITTSLESVALLLNAINQHLAQIDQNLHWMMRALGALVIVNMIDVFYWIWSDNRDPR